MSRRRSREKSQAAPEHAPVPVIENFEATAEEDVLLHHEQQREEDVEDMLRRIGAPPAPEALAQAKRLLEEAGFTIYQEPPHKERRLWGNALASTAPPELTNPRGQTGEPPEPDPVGYDPLLDTIVGEEANYIDEDDNWDPDDILEAIRNGFLEMKHLNQGEVFYKGVFIFLSEIMARILSPGVYRDKKEPTSLESWFNTFSFVYEDFLKVEWKLQVDTLWVAFFQTKEPANLQRIKLNSFHRLFEEEGMSMLPKLENNLLILAQYGGELTHDLTKSSSVKLGQLAHPENADMLDKKQKHQENLGVWPNPEAKAMDPFEIFLQMCSLQSLHLMLCLYRSIMTWPQLPETFSEAEALQLQKFIMKGARAVKIKDAMMGRFCKFYQDIMLPAGRFRPNQILFDTYNKTEFELFKEIFKNSGEWASLSVFYMMDLAEQAKRGRGIDRHAEKVLELFVLHFYFFGIECDKTIANLIHYGGSGRHYYDYRKCIYHPQLIFMNKFEYLVVFKYRHFATTNVWHALLVFLYYLQESRVVDESKAYTHELLEEAGLSNLVHAHETIHMNSV